MSDMMELPADIEIVAPPPPPVHRAGSADLNETGEWLIPRIVEHWSTTPAMVMGWMRGALPSNEQALMRCGDAMGMAHVEPGRMGHPCRVIVDFVLSRHMAEGVDECVEIFAWFAHWAKGHGASGLFRVDDFTDIDRSYIRGRLGKLTKRESFNVVF